RAASARAFPSAAWSPPLSFESVEAEIMQVAARLFFRRRATPSRIAFAMFVRRLLAASKRTWSVVEVDGRAIGAVTTAGSVAEVGVPTRAGAGGTGSVAGGGAVGSASRGRTARGRSFTGAGGR